MPLRAPLGACATPHHFKIAYCDTGDLDLANREFIALVRGGMKPIDALACHDHPWF